jgi:hypothetical protein
MAIQLSVAVRNARLDAIETTIGTSAVMRIFTGAQPANCAAADSGTLLAELSLPSDWLAAAGSGQKAKSGTWEDLLANNSGNAGHFRIYDSGVAACHKQGSITATGGGGDMEVNNIVFAAGQPFTVTAYTLTDGNA